MTRGSAKNVEATLEVSPSCCAGSHMTNSSGGTAEQHFNLFSLQMLYGQVQCHAACAHEIFLHLLSPHPNMLKVFCETAKPTPIAQAQEGHGAPDALFVSQTSDRLM